MSLCDFFQLTETEAETHCWTLASHDPTALPPQDALARSLADRIMEHRCRGCLQHYDAWKRCVEGGPSPVCASKTALEAFIEPIVGLPGNPDAVPLDHLEGFVGEMLWYFLCLEASVEEVVRIEPPGFAPTDPGGDGLVIHRVPDGYLMFRLWEVKKCVRRSNENSPIVNSTVRTAYSQLKARANEYLARYTAIGQELSDPELARFYGQLIELWVEACPEAAAGVSIATSVDSVPRRCFTTFGRHFPRFLAPVRLRGMLTAIGDFSAFTLDVRRYIWTGL